MSLWTGAIDVPDVLPDATHKFFVTAEPQVRAARRYTEYAAAGKLGGRSFDDILCEIKRRDERDSTRKLRRFARRMMQSLSTQAK